MVLCLTNFQLVLVWKKDIKEDIPLTELQLWDCFSYDICITETNVC